MALSIWFSLTRGLTIKAVSKRYEKTALSPTTRFVGHVTVGCDVSVDELKTLYDAIILATGAPHDRPLDIAQSASGDLAQQFRRMRHPVLPQADAACSLAGHRP